MEPIQFPVDEKRLSRRHDRWKNDPEVKAFLRFVRENALRAEAHAKLAAVLAKNQATVLKGPWN